MYFENIILPTLVGIFGGLIGPLLLEKWKGKNEEIKRHALIDVELEKLKEEVNNFFIKTEAKMNSFEQGLKMIELNLAHNIGALKSRFPDAPLEEPGK